MISTDGVDQKVIKDTWTDKPRLDEEGLAETYPEVTGRTAFTELFDIGTRGLLHGMSVRSWSQVCA